MYATCIDIHWFWSSKSQSELWHTFCFTAVDIKRVTRTPQEANSHSISLSAQSADCPLPLWELSICKNYVNYRLFLFTVEEALYEAQKVCSFFALDVNHCALVQSLLLQPMHSNGLFSLAPRYKTANEKIWASHESFSFALRSHKSSWPTTQLNLSISHTFSTN